MERAFGTPDSNIVKQALKCDAVNIPMLQIHSTIISKKDCAFRNGKY
jgi:hypothetical protein